MMTNHKPSTSVGLVPTSLLYCILFVGSLTAGFLAVKHLHHGDLEAEKACHNRMSVNHSLIDHAQAGETIYLDLVMAGYNHAPECREKLASLHQKLMSASYIITPLDGKPSSEKAISNATHAVVLKPQITTE